MTKIKYSDLNVPLKILFVAGWLMIGFNILMFIIGFIIGLMSTV